MTVLRAGELRRRVTIQARSTSQDSAGGQINTWSDVATLYAGITPSVGREMMAAQSMNIDQPATITIRWQKQFSDPKTVAAMRVVYGTRIYNIHSMINEDERNRIITLMASEGLNDG